MSDPARTFYYVGADQVLASGARLVDAPLSRSVVRLGVCRRVFKRLVRRFPAAYIVQVTRFR